MRLFALFIFILAPALCIGQSSYQLGILPSINLNKKLPNDWKLNFKTESRQELKRGYFKSSSDFSYQYVLTDFSFITAKKIGVNKLLAIGYLLKVTENEVINGFIQQCIITKKYSGFKLAHRFSADQTFAKEEDTEYRFRYRLSSAFSLNGQSIDPKELYFKFNNEYLHSWQNTDYDLEIRIVPHLGYKFTESKKLEIGLDYRLDSFLKDSSRNRFWLAINWYYVF